MPIRPRPPPPASLGRVGRVGRCAQTQAAVGRTHASTWPHPPAPGPPASASAPQPAASVAGPGRGRAGTGGSGRAPWESSQPVPARSVLSYLLPRHLCIHGGVQAAYRGQPHFWFISLPAPSSHFRLKHTFHFRPGQSRPCRARPHPRRSVAAFPLLCFQPPPLSSPLLTDQPRPAPTRQFRAQAVEITPISNQRSAAIKLPIKDGVGVRDVTKCAVGRARKRRADGGRWAA